MLWHCCGCTVEIHNRLVWCGCRRTPARLGGRGGYRTKTKTGELIQRLETKPTFVQELCWDELMVSCQCFLYWAGKEVVKPFCRKKKAYFQEKSLNLFQDEADPTGATLQITMTRISSPNLITSRIQITWCRFTSTNRSLPTSATSSVCDTALIHCL